jgi:hypothetical protein
LLSFGKARELFYCLSDFSNTLWETINRWMNLGIFQKNLVVFTVEHDH